VTSATALEYLGGWVVLLALIPIVIAAAPLLVSRRLWQPATIGATVLLAIWALLGAFTIGVYYVPAAVGLLASVFMPIPQGRTPSS
jgi:hypothetical protein